MAFVVETAQREKAKARICMTGVSGSGKTLSALYLAYGMTGEWEKVIVIDTERRRALWYAEREDLGVGKFKHIDFAPPYTVDRYVEAMKLAQETVGEDGVVIIDSGSHAWKGTGGVLDAKENIAQQRGQTDFSAWNGAGKIQNNFIDNIMDMNCHTIVTLRSKSVYAQENNPETGKTSIRKLGLAPVQRDDFDFEFMLVLDMDKETHTASIMKDNTFLEAEGWFGVVDSGLGIRLKEWLSYGVEPLVFRCEDCGGTIKSAQGKKGVLSPSEVAENSKNKFGKEMCMDCVIKKTTEKLSEEVKGEE